MLTREDTPQAPTITFSQCPRCSLYARAFRLIKQWTDPNKKSPTTASDRLGLVRGLIKRYEARLASTNTTGLGES